MKTKHLIIVSAVLVASVSMTLSAQSQDVFSPGTSKDFKLLGLESWFATPIQGKVVKGAPYSAEITTESVQTLSDGNRIVHRSSEKVFRDADGRVRREETSGSKVTVTITDPVAQRSFTLDPAARTARQSPLLPLYGFFLNKPGGLLREYDWVYRGFGPGFKFSRNTVSGTLTLDGRQAQGDLVVNTGRGGRGRARAAGEEYLEEQLPARTIEGVVASGVRRTTTIPKGAIGNEQPIKIVSEEWTSADLQVLVLTDTNDPRSGRSTYKLSNINRADPDPALFKVPSDYTMAGRGRVK